MRAIYPLRKHAGSGAILMVEKVLYGYNSVMGTIVMVWKKVGKKSLIPPGTMKGFNVERRKIIVVNVDGRYIIYDGKCPHASADLSKGELKGEVLICPRHGSEFDVRTGEVLKRTPKLFGMGRVEPLKRIESKEEGEELFADL